MNKQVFPACRNGRSRHGEGWHPVAAPEYFAHIGVPSGVIKGLVIAFAQIPLFLPPVVYDQILAAVRRLREAVVAGTVISGDRTALEYGIGTFGP